MTSAHARYEDLRAGYEEPMRIVNRIVDAIVVVITAPFRAIAALFGRR